MYKLSSLIFNFNDSPQVRESGFWNPENSSLWNPESMKFSLWNPKCWALESGIQLKGSGIRLTIEIQNPSSTDKEADPVSEICDPESMAWNHKSQTELDSLTGDHTAMQLIKRPTIFSK